MYATLWDLDRTQSVEAQVSSWDDAGNKYQKDIFPVEN